MFHDGKLLTVKHSDKKPLQKQLTWLILSFDVFSNSLVTPEHGACGLDPVFHCEVLGSSVVYTVFELVLGFTFIRCVYVDKCVLREYFG